MVGWRDGGGSMALLGAGRPGFDEVKKTALPGFPFLICSFRRAGGRTSHSGKSREK